MDPMQMLALATVVFLVTHYVSSTPLRSGLVAMLGENIYLGLYTLVSLATLGWMIWAYVKAPYERLWVGDERHRHQHHCPHLELVPDPQPLVGRPDVSPHHPPERRERNQSVEAEIDVFAEHRDQARTKRSARDVVGDEKDDGGERKHLHRIHANLPKVGFDSSPAGAGPEGAAVRIVTLFPVPRVDRGPRPALLARGDVPGKLQ